MVDEREEKYEIQDDGEYHFTDDSGYEVDAPEVVAKPAVARVDIKTQVVNFVQVNKKPIIGVLAFIILIFIVYLILSPSSTAPSTEFAAQNTSAKPVLPKPVVPTTTPTPVQQTTTTTTTNTQMPAETMATQVPVVETPPSPAVIINNSPPPVVNTQQPENYMPRSAEVDNELNAMQGKLQDMNARMANMEATLTRLGQMIQELKTMKPANQMQAGAPAKPRPKPFIPKMTFSVQAIIPGRAWLKSENGDTVTVTQGDILQGYGRVVKIDPYDGNVQIDVGGRMITLSYGSGIE